jgi:uncharacterized protein
MQEMILRGHHVLCVHGFRGMGYSPDFVKKMTEIVAAVRDDSYTFSIRVVEGLDEACGACPNRGDGVCGSSPVSDDNVKKLDRRIMSHIGLIHGETIDKTELVRRTAESVRPEHLDELCRGCSWLSYGVCKDGIRLLNEAHRDR